MFTVPTEAQSDDAEARVATAAQTGATGIVPELEVRRVSGPTGAPRTGLAEVLGNAVLLITLPVGRGTVHRGVPTWAEANSECLDTGEALRAITAASLPGAIGEDLAARDDSFEIDCRAALSRLARFLCNANDVWLDPGTCGSCPREHVGPDLLSFVTIRTTGLLPCSRRGLRSTETDAERDGAWCIATGRSGSSSTLAAAAQGVDLRGDNVSMFRFAANGSEPTDWNLGSTAA